MPKKLFSNKDILQLEKSFTTEDLLLYRWLQNSPDDLLQTLIAVLEKQFTNSVITDCFLQDNQDQKNNLSTKKKWRSLLSILLVHELKRYSAHSFHFFKNKPGYDLILTKVLTKIAKQNGHRISCSELSTVEKERTLAQLVLNQQSPDSKRTTQKIFSKATVLALKSVAKNKAPRFLKRLAPAIGWVLLAKDIYDLGGEALRVTVPFVLNIAVYRTLERDK